MLARLLIGFVLIVAAESAPALAQVADSTQSEEALLRELEQEMAATPAARNRPSANPAISVIGDARMLFTTSGPRNVNFEVHEVETAFRSVVDPYARADVFLSIASDDGAFEFELEEAYVTTLSLPGRLQLRAGKFRGNFGRINRFHPHSLPFIDTPAVYENFFGGEGLNDQGVSLSWLLPNQRFFQEITLEVTRGPSENESFVTDSGNRLLYTGHSRNFWDLGPNSTLEFGLSAAAGPNPSGHTMMLGGVDVTWKWKPLRYNTYRSATLQFEGFFGRNDTGEDIISASGFYALAGYQFARRWAVYGRLDHSDRPDDPTWNQSGVSTTMAWYLTEFQKLELGIRRVSARSMDPEYEALFRLVFVIGTHGAHEY